MGHIAAVCAAERGRSSRIGVIAGTRPEAIKLVALVEALRALPAGCLLINSGQHAAMVQRTLQHLGCAADLSLPQIAAPRCRRPCARCARSCATPCAKPG